MLFISTMRLINRLPQAIIDVAFAVEMYATTTEYRVKGKCEGCGTYPRLDLWGKINQLEEPGTRHRHRRLRCRSEFTYEGAQNARCYAIFNRFAA